MGYELQAYEVLKETFTKIVNELKHLSAPRKVQVQFLREAIAKLDVSELPDIEDEAKKMSERSRILSGLMLIIMQDIRNEYSIRSPSSDLLDGLKVVLDISDANKLDPNSECSMLSAAINFIVGQIFTNGKTTEPLLEEHIFTKIPGLNLKAIWSTGVGLKATAENGIFNNAEAGMQKIIQKREEEAAAAHKEKGKAYSSWFGGGKKEPKVKIIDPDAMANPEGSTSAASPT